MTFVAATGDNGWPGFYPAYSPNVLAVGGTSLTLNADDTIQSEVAWSTGTGPGSDSWDSTLGSGGGTSQYETEPAYQDGAQSTGFRTIPDVSFDADPATGVAVDDSFSNGAFSPWEEVGGTSLATPSWAGLIAIINQGRIATGETTLDSHTNPTQTQSLLYALPSSDFNDITVGSNFEQTAPFDGFSAGPGYDEVTGLGTPVANLLVRQMIAPIPTYAVSLDASGNLTIAQEAGGVNDSLNFALSGGNYTFTDAGGLLFDTPTGANAADISGAASSTITIPSSDVASISVTLGAGTNVFTFTGTGGALACANLREHRNHDRRPDQHHRGRGGQRDHFAHVERHQRVGFGRPGRRQRLDHPLHRRRCAGRGQRHWRFERQRQFQRRRQSDQHGDDLDRHRHQ